MKPSLTIVAALTAERVIGHDNAMPWHLPADLAHFKLLTWGKPIVMGRKTFESIGKALPGRRNIVVTRDHAWSAAGVTVAHSLEGALADALRAATAVPEVMVIGGAQLYAECLPRADRLELTWVHASLPGDTHFPEYDAAAWTEVARSEHAADARNAHAMSFVSYEPV